MNIFFVDQADSINKLSFEEARDVVFACWRWNVKQKLAGAGLEYIAIDDLLSKDMCKNVDNFSLLLSKTWYYEEGVDFTKYEDISLGNLYEFSIYYPLEITLKWIACVVSIIKKYEPNKIYHDMPNGSDIAKLIEKVAHSYNYQVWPIDLHNNQPTSGTLDRFAYSTFESADKYNNIKKSITKEFILHPRNLLKILHYNKLKQYYKKFPFAKNILSFYAFLFNFLFPVKSEIPKVLFYCNLHVNNIIKAWLRCSPKPFALVIDLDYPPDPITAIKLNKYKGQVLLIPPMRRKNIHKNSEIEKIIDYWKDIKGTVEFQSQFNFRGVQFFSLVESYLDQVVFSDFPNVINKLIFLEGIFHKWQISVVVVPYDTTEAHRLAVRIAQKNKIPSIAIQHGVYGDRDNDQDRRTADYLAVWGKTYKDIYIEDGRSRETIFVTGAPYMDRYYKMIQIAKQDSIGPKKLSNVLVATTNPGIGICSVPYLLCEKSVSEFIPVLYKLFKESEVKVVLKIHPSESVEYYRYLLYESGLKNIEVVRDSDLGFLLKNSDLVITFNATSVALESMMFGKITINTFLLKGSVLPPYNGEGNLKVVYSGEELESVIRSILQDSQFVTSYNETIAKEAESYMGPIDGNASERSFNVIKELLERH